MAKPPPSTKHVPSALEDAVLGRVGTGPSGVALGQVASEPTAVNGLSRGSNLAPLPPALYQLGLTQRDPSRQPAREKVSTEDTGVTPRPRRRPSLGDGLSL